MAHGIDPGLNHFNSFHFPVCDPTEEVFGVGEPLPLIEVTSLGRRCNRETRFTPRQLRTLLGYHLTTS